MEPAKSFADEAAAILHLTSLPKSKKWNNVKKNLPKWLTNEARHKEELDTEGWTVEWKEAIQEESASLIACQSL